MEQPAVQQDKRERNGSDIHVLCLKPVNKYIQCIYLKKIGTGWDSNPAPAGYSSDRLSIWPYAPVGCSGFYNYRMRNE